MVAGGSSVLINGSETVRIEDARLGRLGLAPEPGAVWSLLSGAALLTLLSARRRAPRTAHVHSRGGL
jgi:hypothetical protein